MSRVGNKPIPLPKEVSVEISSNKVKVTGPKGTLNQYVDPDIVVHVGESHISVKRLTEQKRHKALHGLYRSLISNMVQGVNQGYKLTMELVGVGYKAAAHGQVLELNLGYSHNIFMQIPSEIKVSTQVEKGKSPMVIIEGIDKQLVGQMAAKIKSFRPVEPYKGKGVKLAGEHVRRKAGKTAAK